MKRRSAKLVARRIHTRCSRRCWSTAIHRTTGAICCRRPVPRMARKPDPVWPENSIRRIPSSTKGYISVQNFGICEPTSAPETPRITQETPKSWTRRIPPARQPFMTDASVAAVMTTRLDQAGEVGHCWFIQPAREISRKRNGSRHSDIGSSHYRRRQGLSLAVSDRSSFRAIRHPKFNQGLHLRPKLRDLRVGECSGNSTDQTGDAKIVDTAYTSGLRWRAMYSLRLVSPTARPSLSSSP